MGIISAIGRTPEEQFSNLVQAKSGLQKLQQIDSIYRNKIRVGEINSFNEQLAKELNLSHDHNYTRTAILGCLAAKWAVSDAGLSLSDLKNDALISATTVGGMDMTERYFKEFGSNPEVQKFIDSHEAGDSTNKIAEHLGIDGFVTTISTACSSGANALMLAARLIRSGKAERVIAGGTDALSKFTINGFNSLMILSSEACKPFDRHRDGLNLGEAAAYLVLESEASANSRGARIRAWLSGYGNSNDSHHQTASSPEGDGAFLAMKAALESSGLQPAQIDYVNAHGTATPNNDLSESKALLRIFGDSVPPFSSTKPFTGHTLAAAGAVEAVFSILAMEKGVLLPNLNYNEPIIETALQPETACTPKALQHVLSNSFGFGGNCTTLILSKP